MEIIKGGFALNHVDEVVVNQQRAITAKVNNDFIQVGAIFLRMSGKNPYNSDWYKQKFRDTNLQEWIDNPTYRDLNLGFNLQFGWLDVDIDAGDIRYNQCIIKAMKFCGIDTRFAFGRLSKQVPSHLLVQLNEADVTNYDSIKEFEPKEFKIDGERYKTELRSMGPLTDTPNTVKQARQTVMPGSIYASKADNSKYDISVWYNNENQPAKNVTEIAETTSRKVAYADLITGIAFGTFLFVMQPYWTEGNRQNLAITVCGWLARLVLESIGINHNEGVQSGTFCPIGSPETAESMLEFLCTELGDTESFMRKRVFRDALKKLENNPDAKIPGWNKLEGEIGTQLITALRTVCMPGVDVSKLTQMADRYIYNESDDAYIDRDRFLTVSNYTHDSATLDRRHRNDFLEVSGKSKPLFKIFECSPLRRRIGGMDLCPDLAPGSLYRISRGGEVIPDDQTAEPGTLTMFNTWRGWPILPTPDPDPIIIAKCNSMLDRLFGYLSQDNAAQTKWLKQWIAWTVQFPGQKQQVSPVFVGGQGVGKSFFGNIFLQQLFQNQWGSASPKVLEGNFSVEPFINKMFVFIDEAKFYNDSSIDEIKKLIRNDQIPGAEKFKSSQTFHIFARIVFASNRFDMNIAQRNTKDRALFYIKTYDKDFMHMTELEFERWTLTIKPFFQEFNSFIRRTDVKEHLMYIFDNMPVDRFAIEDLSLSSSTDAIIVDSNMSSARRVAKGIIEEGRVWEDLDISAPFTIVEFGKRISDTCQSMQIKAVQPRFVLEEFQNAGLIEQFIENRTILWRFKYKIGTLTEMFSMAIGVPLTPRFVFDENDFGINESDLLHSKKWKGSASNRLHI